MFSNIYYKRKKKVFLTDDGWETVRTYGADQCLISEIYIKIPEGYLYVYRDYIGLYESVNMSSEFKTLDISDLIFDQRIKDEILLFIRESYNYTKEKILGRTILSRYRINILCLEILNKLKEI